MTIKSLSFGILFLFVQFLAWAQEPRQYETQHILRGHVGGVYNLRFSPDGKTLATCGLDGNIFLWDVNTGANKNVLKGHLSDVIEVTFSHDGKRLASGGADGTARIWDVVTGNQLNQYTADLHNTQGPKRKGISFVVFSIDDNTLYYGGESGYLMTVGLGAGAAPPRRLFSTNKTNGDWYSNITGGALSNNGQFLYLSVGNNLIVIDVTTGRYSSGITRSASDFNDVICGPQPNMMTAWAWDGKVLIYDVSTQAVIKELQVTQTNNFSLASFNKEKNLLVTGADANMAKVWDWENNVRVAILAGHTRIVRTARFSPTEDVIATASYDGSARIWRQPKDIPNTPEIKKPDDNTVAKKTDPLVILRDTIREKVVVREEVVLRDTVREKVVLKDTVRVKVKETVTEKATEASITEKDLEVGKTLNLKNLQFKQGTAELLPMSKPELERLSELMRKYPKLVIELAGHTDNVGQASLNMRLAADRVRVVQNYLTGEGIAEKRILTRSYGGTKPIASNETEETRRLNRRVEVTIIAL